MPPEEGEQYRREVVRRLEREKHQAKLDLAKAQARNVEIEAQLLRAQSPLQLGFCPQCWIMHSKENLLVSAPHSDAQHFDMCECEECGYSEEHRTGAR